MGEICRREETVELTQLEITEALREAAAKKLGLPSDCALLRTRIATFGKAWDAVGQPDKLLLLESCKVPIWWFWEKDTLAPVELSE